MIEVVLAFGFGNQFIIWQLRIIAAECLCVVGVFW